jgi:hypothetical protein
MAIDPKGFRPVAEAGSDRLSGHPAFWCIKDCNAKSAREETPSVPAEDAPREEACP